MRINVAKVTEAGFQKTVLEFAKLHGWRTAHFRPAKTAKGWRTAVSGDGKGFPDVVLVRGTRLIFVELKVPPNRLSVEQMAWLVDLKQTCAEVHLWYPNDWDEIERVLGW